MYIVFPVLLFESSVASFILCASPPESSVDGCPNLMYESPTSLRVSIFLLTDGTFSKKSTASSIVMSRTSYMLLSLYLTSRVSLLYLLPLHTSHGTNISAKKCISIFFIPSPLQASQRPPFTLKLKRPDL